jgi:hypothetical protein
VHTAWKGMQHIDCAFLDSLLKKLTQFDSYSRQRKIELHLIPALRRASTEAEQLITDLEGLYARGSGALRLAAEHLGAVFALHSVKVHEVCLAMEMYCRSAFARLEREEKELLPLASRLFSIDDWFGVAARFLAEDGNAAANGVRRAARVEKVDRWAQGLN